MRDKIRIIAMAAVAVLAPAPAHALTFAWSYIDNKGTLGIFPDFPIPDGRGSIVRGSISGLAEGYNDVSDLVFEVTDVPDPFLAGGGWTPYIDEEAIPDQKYIVVNGQITIGRVWLTRVNNGVGQSLVFDNTGTYFPGSPPDFPAFTADLYTEDLYARPGARIYSSSLPVTYTATSAAVPEPATWLFMALGFGLAGGAVRRRRKLSAI